MIGCQDNDARYGYQGDIPNLNEIEYVPEPNAWFVMKKYVFW